MKSWEAVGIAIALMVSVAIMGHVIQVKGFESQEAAAWAQALGSVLAIAAAARLAFIPIEHEHRRRREARDQFLDMVQEAMALATLHLASFVVLVAKGDGDIEAWVREWDRSGAERALEELLKVSFGAWPGAFLYGRVHRIGDRVRKLRADIGDHQSTLLSEHAVRARLADDLITTMNDMKETAEFMDDLRRLA